MLIRVLGVWFRIQGLGLRVQGLGFFEDGEVSAPNVLDLTASNLTLESPKL